MPSPKEFQVVFLVQYHLICPYDALISRRLTLFLAVYMKNLGSVIQCISLSTVGKTLTIIWALTIDSEKFIHGKANKFLSPERCR